MTDHAPAGIGHNMPPPYDREAWAAFRDRVREFADAAGAWADKGAPEDEDAAAKLRDFVEGARGLEREVDEARKAAKAPFDAGAKAVQAAFMPLIDGLKITQRKAKDLLTAYGREVERRQKAEAARLAAEAEAARKAAETHKAQAEVRHDLLGGQEAERKAEEARQAAEAAEKAGQARARIGSASGGARALGMRTERRARITNLRLVFAHFHQHPELRALLERLANAEIRAAKGGPVSIPGVEIDEERRVA